MNPVESTAYQRALRSQPRAHQVCSTDPPPELTQPWDGHGGVTYLVKKDEDGNVVTDANGNPVPLRDWSGMRVPGHRVITVGYKYDELGTANPLDKDTIQEALWVLHNCPLQRIEDGSPAYSDPQRLHLYEPDTEEIIVIKGGVDQKSVIYTESIAIGAWVHLVADGAVTIRGEESSPQVVYVKRVTSAGVLSPRKVRIGGPGQTRDGSFHLEPFASATGLETNQRGIDCESGSHLDVSKVTFSGFRAFGSGAAIRNFRGAATDCVFEDCVALVSSSPSAREDEKSANGGAISGISERSLYDASVPPRRQRYLYTRPSLSSCTFTNCVARNDGGAVTTFGNIDKCSFNGCRAETGNGGACHDVTSVEYSRFDGCRAGSADDGDGGALYYVHGWIDARVLLKPDNSGDLDFDAKYFLRNCVITACTASRGGAIAKCEVNITDCFIDSNTATGAGGGGLFEVGGGRFRQEDGSYEKKGDIDRCSITRNSAVVPPAKRKAGKHNGGGLHSCSGKITNCIVAANHAGGDGGGLFNCDGALRHLDILQNKADGLGGGARNCNGPIQNCIILGNWSLKSGVNADSNQLSNCAAPSHCFLPKGWTGGSNNNRDKGEGPGFRDPPPDGPGAVPPADFGRDDDPTTLPYYEILDIYVARKLRLTTDSKGLLDSGKKDLPVDRDFENLMRPRPVGATKPDIGAFEFPAP